MSPVITDIHHFKPKVELCMKLYNNEKIVFQVNIIIDYKYDV